MNKPDKTPPSPRQSGRQPVRQSAVSEILDTMSYGPAPESPSAATAWLASQAAGFDHFVNGSWLPAEGPRFASINPANGHELAQVAQASPAQVDAAVAAARAALPAWQATSGHQRAKCLYAIARELQKHARLFAVLETLDNGKPIRESRDIDIPLAIRHFYHHAGWAQLLDSEYAGHEAVGVVGQIVPWNFPLLMLAWKLAPALACGNTVVFKPAESTSLTAVLFAELAQRVGLPPGVLNIITGDGAVGQAIVAHPGVDKLAFTGSTEVGRAIREATAGSGKRLSLELGGKSPYIVFADADLDGAVEGLVDSIFFNQGQVCCAGSRLLVQESVQADLLARLRTRMAKIRVGDPLDKNTDMGAIVDATQLKRISRLVDGARDQGLTVWQPETSLPATGCFYPPTLVSDADPSAEIAMTEVFGPVLVAMSFRTPAEAVALANNSVYGLASSVWSESISLALEVAPQIQAGVVWVNSANRFDASCGFGGYRQSGFGREGGREGLREYLKPRAAAARLAPAAAANFTSTASTTRTTPTKVAAAPAASATINRTAKLYVGGAQQRPDGGYTRAVQLGGREVGQVPEGNRKDIRNAVEAARKATGWAANSAHGRAQVLYYLAENLAARAQDFANLLALDCPAEQAIAEVEASIDRLFHHAAWADKYDGAVHQAPLHGIVTAVNEPIGVIGLICPDEAPLLALVAMLAPAVAMGNRVVLLPSRRHPLVATEFYQLLDTSDLPGGVVNIVTGPLAALVPTLAGHADVDAIWRHDGDAAGCAEVEKLSAGNLKRCWVTREPGGRDWFDAAQGAGREFLEQATQVKNIWIPYGV